MKGVEWGGGPMAEDVRLAFPLDFQVSEVARKLLMKSKSALILF